MRRLGWRRAVYLLCFALPVFAFLFYLFFYEGVFFAVLLLSCAILHECGHLLAFSLLRLPPPRLTLVRGGVRLSTDVSLSYRQEGLIAMAGPCANLAGALCTIPFLSLFPPLFNLFAVQCLTAGYNLLPMGDLDGERILRVLLLTKFPPRPVLFTLRILSFCCLSVSLFVSLFSVAVRGVGAYTAVLSGLSLWQLCSERK